MISECFLHCRGIGPRTNEHLKQAGFSTWDDCIRGSETLPLGGKKRKSFIDDIMMSKEAHESGDINFFLTRLPTSEHWRILSLYHDRATYFDIETTGLSWGYSHASVIAAYKDGEVHRFVYGENLDDFLLLLDASTMLVSFNGNCFDVPFIEKTFNIPSIGRPHLDLRWVAYHQGYRGGLKAIEREIGISRPEAIRDVDGLEAVELYYRWQAGDMDAREKLIEYCSADAVSTYQLAMRLLG
ncbi:MAG: exonuclease, partial [Spirochaetales bacterium]